MKTFNLKWFFFFIRSLMRHYCEFFQLWHIAAYRCLRRKIFLKFSIKLKEVIQLEHSTIKICTHMSVWSELNEKKFRKRYLKLLQCIELISNIMVYLWCVTRNPGTGRQPKFWEKAKNFWKSKKHEKLY